MLLDIITENSSDKDRVYKIKPVHDWSSHAADAMRTLATGLKDLQQSTTTKCRYKTTIMRQTIVRHKTTCAVVAVIINYKENSLFKPPKIPAPPPIPAPPEPDFFLRR